MTVDPTLTIPQSHTQYAAMRPKKSLLRRGQSAKIRPNYSNFGSKAAYRNHIRNQKEAGLTELQQSRKEIMVQRLELHNMRDQIEILFHQMMKGQRKAKIRARKIQSANIRQNYPNQQNVMTLNKSSVSNQASRASLNQNSQNLKLDALFQEIEKIDEKAHQQLFIDSQTSKSNEHIQNIANQRQIMDHQRFTIQRYQAMKREYLQKVAIKKQEVTKLRQQMSRKDFGKLLIDN